VKSHTQLQSMIWTSTVQIRKHEYSSDLDFIKLFVDILSLYILTWVMWVCSHIHLLRFNNVDHVIVSDIFYQFEKNISFCFCQKKKLQGRRYGVIFFFFSFYLYIGPDAYNDFFVYIGPDTYNGRVYIFLSKYEDSRKHYSSIRLSTCHVNLMWSYSTILTHIWVTFIEHHLLCDVNKSLLTL